MTSICLGVVGRQAQALFNWQADPNCPFPSDEGELATAVADLTLASLPEIAASLREWSVVEPEGFQAWLDTMDLANPSRTIADEIMSHASVSRGFEPHRPPLQLGESPRLKTAPYVREVETWSEAVGFYTGAAVGAGAGAVAGWVAGGSIAGEVTGLGYWVTVKWVGLFYVAVSEAILGGLTALLGGVLAASTLAVIAGVLAVAATIVAIYLAVIAALALAWVGYSVGGIVGSIVESIVSAIADAFKNWREKRKRKKEEKKNENGIIMIPPWVPEYVGSDIDAAIWLFQFDALEYEFRTMATQTVQWEGAAVWG